MAQRVIPCCVPPVLKRRPICQSIENYAENTEIASSDESIMQRFVRPVFFRSILPLKSMLDNISDILTTRWSSTRGTGGAEKNGLIRSKLALGKIKQGTHGTPLKITSPEPRSHLTINLSKIIIHPSCTIARKFFV